MQAKKKKKSEEKAMGDGDEWSGGGEVREAFIVTLVEKWS